jgi:hypothetical protein
MGQYVGIDLHRRSTTIVSMAEDGEVLSTERFVSQPFELARAMAAAGPEPEVVLESTSGWYGPPMCSKSSAPTGTWPMRWGTTGGTDASRTTCATPRTGPPCWRSGAWPRAGSHPRVRELRELVRYRYSLVGHRTSAKAQIHGVMAKNGILPVVGEMWGPTGQAQLDRLELPEASAIRLDSLRNLLDVYEAAIAELDAHIHAQLKADPG